MAKKPKARPVTSGAGVVRWACRVCGLSYDADQRTKAEQCCSKDYGAEFTAGGELIPPGHRDRQELISQLETRMADLDKEAHRRAAEPPSPYPCSDCRWSKGYECQQPLVKGFDLDIPPAIDWQIMKFGYISTQEKWQNINLCGREKLLWEQIDTAPGLTRLDHLMKAIFG